VSKEPVLTVLHRLRPDANPFGYYRQYRKTKRAQLAAGLFDSLTRLVIPLLLMRIPSDANYNDMEQAVVEALSDEEKQVFSAIRQWFEFFAPKSQL
jgi:hypothetical protein